MRGREGNKEKRELTMYIKRYLTILSFLFLTTIIACGVPIDQTFKEITGEKLPIKSQILRIEDSPTDFHGDYGRVLIVKVESDFYNNLPNKLIQKGLKVDTENPMINEFEEINNYIKFSDIDSHYKYFGDYIYYYVGFYNDKETILLIRSSW